MDRLGVKVGLTVLSLAATFGGWAILANREPLLLTETTTTQPAAAPIYAKRRAGAGWIRTRLAPAGTAAAPGRRLRPGSCP